MNQLRPCLIAVSLSLFTFCSSVLGADNVTTALAEPRFVYFAEKQLVQVKAEINAGSSFFVQQYSKLLAQGDSLLTRPSDPVVNKTVIPPSGDIHDYISYAPYRWPDETKKDGLPWKAVDGVVNPVSRGRDTDYTRLRDFSAAMEILSFAYYFSEEAKYSDKGLELLRIWFVDAETRVNPNINYGQAVPGLAEARPAGIIEWSRISTVITAMQIYEKGQVLPLEMKTQLLEWMNRYLDWLLTNRLGKEADALPQDHANWYNYQVVGLMIFLGRIDEAKAKVEDAKTSRIAAQIIPDGRRPKEIGRTKSMHYSTMNLWALANLTYMGRKLGIDLWDFQTEDGRSLPQAHRFLEPYAFGVKIWPFRQITNGGAAEAIKMELKPLFRKTSTLSETKLGEKDLNAHHNLSPLDALRYPVFFNTLDRHSFC